MVTFFAWVGLIVGILLALGILLWGVASLADYFEGKRSTKLDQKIMRMEMAMWAFGIKLREAHDDSILACRCPKGNMSDWPPTKMPEIKDDVWYQFDFFKPVAELTKEQVDGMTAGVDRI